MSSKTPIRTVFNDSNVATGLAEFQTGEFIPLSHGGLGAVGLFKQPFIVRRPNDALKRLKAFDSRFLPIGFFGGIDTWFTPDHLMISSL